MPTQSSSPFSIYYPSLDDPANIQDAFLIYHLGPNKNSENPDTASIAGYLTSLTTLKANLAGPTFTGTVTLPTGTTKIGNTSLVQGGTVNITLPTNAGILVGSGDTATVTNTMLAGSIANNKLSHSAVLIGDKTVTLGATATTDLTGLTSVASTSISTTGDVTVGGNLTVNGTTTTVNSTTVTIKDKNIELGVVTSPTNSTANGGGITLKAGSDIDKTFSWVSSTSSWTSSENINLASGKVIKIDGSQVLSESNYVGTSALATALAGGTSTDGVFDIGQIPYQTASGETQFTQKGNPLNLLQLKNGVPTWVDYSADGTIANATLAGTSSTSVVVASTSSNTVYPIFVDSATSTNPTGIPLKTSSTNLSFVPSTGVLSATKFNGLTLTSATTGFTISGGTTSKTLTISGDATVSGTNTGDQTITLTGDVTGFGTGSFATSIGSGKVTNDMLAGSIANAKLANSKITLGSTDISLGQSAVTTLPGVTSINGTNIPSGNKTIVVESTSGNISQKAATAGAADTATNYTLYGGSTPSTQTTASAKKIFVQQDQPATSGTNAAVVGDLWFW
jgi:hypothetical protein